MRLFKLIRYKYAYNHVTTEQTCIHTEAPVNIYTGASMLYNIL